MGRFRRCCRFRSFHLAFGLLLSFARDAFVCSVAVVSKRPDPPLSQRRRTGLATTHEVRARHGQLTDIGRARRLKLRPLIGTLCAVLIIIRDLKHHLLGHFVLHIIGKIARFVGAFAPVLSVVNKGGRHKVPLTRQPQVARTSPPRFHPINQTDHYDIESSLTESSARAFVSFPPRRAVSDGGTSRPLSNGAIPMAPQSHCPTADQR